jgi:hypothetical protein
VAAEQRGVTAFNEQDAAKAQVALEEALQASPGFARAREELGMALLAQGRFGEAETQLRRALADAGYAGAKGRAGVEAQLALALVKGGSHSSEAVRLALRSAEYVGNDPAHRPWQELLIGGAFAATGNRACAVEHLRKVKAVPGVPEGMVARAAELIGQVEREHPSARTDCFQYEVYEEATIAGIWSGFRRDHPGALETLGAAHSVFLHPAQWYAVRARWTGRQRPVGAELASIFKEGAGSPMGLTVTWRELGAHFSEEFEVEERGVRYWLPVQAPLRGPLAKEFPKGGEATFYGIFLGAVDGAPLIILNELDQAPCNPVPGPMSPR